ncbi:Apoptosis regulator BAX [Collichthys lucidus]|uniref:Apoptosis regulator BAX n=1 Tax=Collichthys lucidus TaxID=240159 RepID=A0A4U5VWA0_COLLU|nr:Apoptosis regulator BAX [Collichthys lucidus]
MACEGNGISDERIGEALIKEVIKEELKDVSSDCPPLTPLAVEVKTAQEQKIVTQLGIMIRIIGDRVKDDKEFQDAIDGVACCPGSKWDRFKEVAAKVFQHGINWERIAVLFYVAGKLAVRFLEAHLPQSVTDILKWTVDFFKKNLLDWIREHGGWEKTTAVFKESDCTYTTLRPDATANVIDAFSFSAPPHRVRPNFPSFDRSVTMKDAGLL